MDHDEPASDDYVVSPKGRAVRELTNALAGLSPEERAEIHAELQAACEHMHKGNDFRVAVSLASVLIALGLIEGAP